MEYSPSTHGLFLLLVIAPAAACYPLLKLGLESAPSLRFAGSRALVAGLALLFTLAVSKQSLFPGRSLVWWTLPVGLMATSLTFGAMFLSADFLSTGIATVLGNIQPLVMIFLASFFLGESLTKVKLFAAKKMK